MSELKNFIEKMANSANPMLKNLAIELQQMNPQVSQPTVQPAIPPQEHSPELPDVNQTIESDNIVGTETSTKGTDEIDKMLSTQMPELADEENANQSRFSKQKVATVRDVILARRRK